MLDLKFSRIQFTPDLMPSDITGTDLVQEDATTGRRQMVFAPGPIFANIVLADEINRTPPKTQSALLEAMQEHRVTIQGRTYQLAEPFYVFATQNPIELEGTYPLPEAQLDRFMFHIIIEHPPYDEEIEVVRTTTAILAPEFSRPVSGDDLVAFQRLVRKVPVAEPVMRHALDIVRASRPKDGNAPDLVKKFVAFGASVRAAQYLVLGGKARALTSGRYHVSFEDIRALAHPVLRHRIITNFHAQSEGVTSDDVVDRLLQAVPLPRSGNVGVARRNPRVPGARFMDPKVLARIGNLELVSKAVVDGFINGLHKAPYFGASVDFAEHRGYVPGDDIRRMDWRVWARTDRYYIKEYEAESNMNFSVLLDVSKSMDYGGKGIKKIDYARIIAACLTSLVSHQRDRVGMAAFDSDIVEYVPPSAKHLETVLHVLDRLKPGRPGSLKEPLHKLAEHYGRRGVLVLISDFYEDPETVIEAVKPLRFRGNDIMVFHVLDKDELDFGFADASPFEDLETGEQVPVVPDSLRKEYRAMVQAHIAALTQSFSKVGRGLHAVRHVAAAGLRAVPLPERAIAPPQETVRGRCPSSRRCSSLALAGLAIPVLLHLTQKEKKEVVYFPSLMFVRKIPYQASRRRRIQHWFLLMLRLAALALIILAFARPLLTRRRRAGGAGAGRARSGGAARHQLQHGLRPALGGRHRSGARRGVAARRVGPRLDRRLRLGHRDPAAQHVRAERAQQRHRVGQARRVGHALRARAQGGGKPARRVAAAASRSGAHQRLPALGLARAGGHGAAGRRHAHAGRDSGHGDAGRT